VTEEVAEWDYGDYEGLLSSEIKVKDPNWVIWRDGCPGGESPKDIQKRIDAVIAKVSGSAVFDDFISKVMCRSERGTGCIRRRVQENATVSGWFFHLGCRCVKSLQ
jgi:hypothetical protein